MRKNLKVTIGFILIIASIVFLIVSSFMNTTSAYYITVKEVLNTQIDYDLKYRIEGNIDAEKAIYDLNQNPVKLQFELYDDSAEETITVIYYDIKPDNFHEATGAIVEGKFNSDGTFHAETLNLKCPSKYEEDQNEDMGAISNFLKSLGLKN